MMGHLAHTHTLPLLYYYCEIAIINMNDLNTIMVHETKEDKKIIDLKTALINI